jgi:Carbon-nitrogen hydrolase
MRTSLVSAFSVLMLASAAWAGCPGSETERCGSPAESDLPEGWSTHAPRDELRPEFVVRLSGGYGDAMVCSLIADERKGLAGWWQTTLPVSGGRTYDFKVHRRCRNVKSPRRSGVVRIHWRDENGQPVSHDEVSTASFLPDTVPRSEPEFPRDGETDDSGWQLVSGRYRVPQRARQAVIEMHSRWAPDSQIDWSGLSLTEAQDAAPRSVRIATVHHRALPGNSPAEMCRQFDHYIDEAAKRNADLVVLPEVLTQQGTGLKFIEAAEPIPGPSTKYFAELARKHDLYIVAGLIERDQHLMYNTSVLVGPDGELVGKYRKVCLPRTEIEEGFEPGDEYPVFETRFGKVGMMICYDGFFPEVARELSNRGAEVIAWPGAIPCWLRPGPARTMSTSPAAAIAIPASTGWSRRSSTMTARSWHRPETGEPSRSRKLI